jgi:hypothetical protein
MCLACEGLAFVYRDFAASFLDRGEMPPGFTAADLEALGFVPPFPVAGATEEGRRGADKASATTTEVFRCGASGDE